MGGFGIVGSRPEWWASVMGDVGDRAGWADAEAEGHLMNHDGTGAEGGEERLLAEEWGGRRGEQRDGAGLGFEC